MTGRDILSNGVQPRHAGPLTWRQQLFVTALVGGARSGADAARRAGYSRRRANRAAHELLKHARVRRALECTLRQFAAEAAELVAAAIRGEAQAGRYALATTLYLDVLRAVGAPVPQPAAVPVPEVLCDGCD